MKKCRLTGAICLILILLSGCGAADAYPDSKTGSGSGIPEEQPAGVKPEVISESGEEGEPGSLADDTASGTGEETAIPEKTADHIAAYESFLAGNLFWFDTADIKTWRLDIWKDILLSGGELEYIYLDLDGDGVEELLVQYEESPEAYNGVFHYEDGKLYCWQHDDMEGNCRDYPLRDGTMVRQYDYGGTSSYTLFRYRSDGIEEKITNLFIREELIDPDSTDPCPYYEVGGMEVDKDKFEEQLKNLITDWKLDNSAWTAL